MIGETLRDREVERDKLRKDPVRDSGRSKKKLQKQTVEEEALSQFET